MTQEDREFVALMVQVAGLIATVPLTFLCRRRQWAPAIGIAMGFVVNAVGQIGIAGGGPGACAGVVVLPLYGWLISWLTLKFAAWRRW